MFGRHQHARVYRKVQPLRALNTPVAISMPSLKVSTGSSLVEQLVHARLRDARLVGHLMKRGHVLQVGDGEVCSGSAHALLDAPPEHVAGVRELLQDLPGICVQLGQRALATWRMSFIISGMTPESVSWCS